MTEGIFEDFIGVWENNVDENLCKEFIKYYDWAIKNSYNIIGAHEKPKHSNREDTSLFVGATSLQYPEKLTMQYWKCLDKCIEEYMKNYSIEIVGNLHSWVFKVHKVEKSQGYHIWHYESDNYDTRDRFLAYMTILEAPSEGGETEFLYQSKRIKPEVGKTLIWPAGFTHKHRGNPPLKGEKIYVTGWANMYPTI